MQKDHLYHIANQHRYMSEILHIQAFPQWFISKSSTKSLAQQLCLQWCTSFWLLHPQGKLPKPLNLYISWDPSCWSPPSGQSPVCLGFPSPCLRQSCHQILQSFKAKRYGFSILNYSGICQASHVHFLSDLKIVIFNSKTSEISHNKK